MLCTMSLHLSLPFPGWQALPPFTVKPAEVQSRRVIGQSHVYSLPHGAEGPREEVWETGWDWWHLSGDPGRGGCWGVSALAPSGGHAVAGQPGGVPGCRKGTLAGAGQGCSTIQQVMGGGSSLGFLWGLTAARHMGRERTCSPPGIEPWSCVEGGLGHCVTADRGTTLGLASLCPGFLT